MKRTEQREHIFKLIFGADFNEESEQGTQTELYLEQIEGATEKDMQYISQKAQKIIEKIDEIDTLINEHTTGWKTGRMNKVDLTILRLAVYEMKWDEDVPTGVAINEAVNLAKKYSSEDGASVVNGVLAKLADKSEVENGSKCIYSKTGEFLYKEYVHPGLYAEPYLCKRRSL